MSLHLHPDQDALFLDIDGTLLDIAPTPGGVEVPEPLLQDLARLHEKMGGALALISGRSLTDIDSLFAPLHLPASGAHGAEWRIARETKSKNPLPDSLRHAILDTFASYPAILIEDKKYSVAVHYRQAPELEDMADKLLQKIITEARHPLSIIQGKMVFEVICPWYNKGAAIETFMVHPSFAGRRPVFLGDDETDVAAINTCRRFGGIGVKIGANEASSEIAFATPAKVREWISAQA